MLPTEYYVKCPKHSIPKTTLYTAYVNFTKQVHYILNVKYSILNILKVCSSGETLCRDNCQLIGMPFFHTRSAGKNNRN